MADRGQVDEIDRGAMVVVVGRRGSRWRQVIVV